MDIIVLIILIIAISGYSVGYTIAAKKHLADGSRIVIGLLCAVGCILLVAAIVYGACVYMLRGL